ncbi:MAG: PadR family transcriptional regulator [Cyclobacteriaceae bacterium]|nr:PadR family transcriptional regulator [Cyclobacteriaceae bacterium]
MKRTYLGEFEELVLLTVASLMDDAYGVSIMNEISNQSGRESNISAIHAVLKRLESKGFLKSKMGGATTERGGRRKRYFQLTNSGRKTVDQTIELRIQLFNRVPGYSLKLS